MRKPIAPLPHCTRCHDRVSDSDPEARFKHNEIIACGKCSVPSPRHQYHRNCQCQPCQNVRAVLMQ